MRMITSLQLEKRAKMKMMIKMSDSEEEPSKKKQRKESFSLGFEVLPQYIEFDEGQPVYFEKQKLQEKPRKPRRDWSSLMLSEGSINEQLMLIKIYMKGIKMSVGFIHGMQICQ